MIRGLRIPVLILISFGGTGVPVAFCGTGNLTADLFAGQGNNTALVVLLFFAVLLMAVSIRKRKKSEAELIRTKRFLETILDNTPMGVACLDGEFNYLKVNTAYARLHGRAPSCFTAENHFDLFPHEDDEKNFRGVIEKGQPHFEYARFVKKEREQGGAPVYWDMSVVPIKTPRDDVTGAVLTIVDVSERKAVERELIQADKMVSLGVLVSGVAHEINNPNNFITVNASLMEKTWPDILPVLDERYKNDGGLRLAGIPYAVMRDRVPRLLSGISEGGRRIDRIVKDLKRFAQPHGSALDEPVDLNAVVRSALNLIRKMITDHTDHFVADYGADLPVVTGSGRHLEQVVINLIQNACYALPDKGHAVHVVTGRDPETDAVILRVADEGKGIPREDLPRLMDPFFTTRRTSGGTGLGLSVASAIVREHSGRITVESEPGKGSVFTVSLPLSREMEMKKVLVVEDEPDSSELIVKLLNKKYICRIETASNGIECCLRLGTFQPDIMILDINMPEMNGVEVCRRMKSNPALFNIDVVVVTGLPDSDRVREIKEMGFVKVLAKPLLPSALYEAVDGRLA